MRHSCPTRRVSDLRGFSPFRLHPCDQGLKWKNELLPDGEPLALILPDDRRFTLAICAEDAVEDDQRVAVVATRRFIRSEEHTSELQSLMRISYAVFCFKNKTKLYTTITNMY